MEIIWVKISTHGADIHTFVSLQSASKLSMKFLTSLHEVKMYEVIIIIMYEFLKYLCNGIPLINMIY